MSILQSLRFVAASVLGASAVLVAVADDVPVRGPSGQALAVPADQLERGEVYHVAPGMATQLTWTAETPLVRVVATCNRVVGYVLAPFDLDEKTPPVLAGALRVPTAALRTGVPSMDAELHGEEVFNTAAFPELTLLIADVSDVERLGDEGGRTRYKLKAKATLTVKDRTTQVELPLELLFVPFTWGTMQFNLGDFVIVRGGFEATAEQLGFPAPDAKTKDFRTAAARFDLNLVCSTAAPDKNIDPRVKTEDFVRQLQFVTLLRDFDDPARAYAFGREFADSIWDDGPALNRVAWTVLDEPDVRRRDLAFVGRLAERADTLLKSGDGPTLRTRARWHYERGELAEAITTAEAAVQHLARLSPDEAEPIRADLVRYQAEGGQTPSPTKSDKSSQ